jgi:hypothetical protein
MIKEDIKLLRVMCPYCTVGSAWVEVKLQHGADTLDKRPRQCSSCKRYFKLQIEFTVIGQPIETKVDVDKAFRESLKELF